MRDHRKKERFPLAVFWLWILISGCATKHFLSVTYQLPPPAAVAMPRTIRLSVTDSRPQGAFLSPSARDALGSVSETLNLLVKDQSEPAHSIGAYPLVPLVEAVIQRRLSRDGIQTASTAREDLPELAIELREFWLDLTNRRWTLTITYRIAQLKDRKPLYQETISGQAERLNIVGRKDAERLIGELLTDLANRIEPHRVFQTTGR